MTEAGMTPLGTWNVNPGSQGQEVLWMGGWWRWGEMERVQVGGEAWGAIR